MFSFVSQPHPRCAMRPVGLDVCSVAKCFGVNMSVSCAKLNRNIFSIMNFYFCRTDNRHQVFTERHDAHCYSINGSPLTGRLYTLPRVYRLHTPRWQSAAPVQNASCRMTRHSTRVCKNPDDNFHRSLRSVLAIEHGSEAVVEWFGENWAMSDRPIRFLWHLSARLPMWMLGLCHH